MPEAIAVVPIVNPLPPAPQERLPAPSFVKTPDELAGQPDMPVVGGSPLALVSVSDDGVPPAPLRTTNAPAEPVLTARAVATPVPRPETPVLIGKPVQLVNVPLDGVPSAGVTSVGLVAKTNAPLPVSSVTAAARFALDGVARNVATFEPRPETPVDIGSPVALVSVRLDGVPPAPSKTTNAPALPTFTANAVATPVPKPEMPVATGSPVQFVNVPLLGVPRAGVVNDGEMSGAFRSSAACKSV